MWTGKDGAISSERSMKTANVGPAGANNDSMHCGSPHKPASVKAIIVRLLGLVVFATILSLLGLTFGVPFLGLSGRHPDVSFPMACAIEGQKLGLILLASFGVLAFASGLCGKLIGGRAAVAPTLQWMATLVYLIGFLVLVASNIARLLLKDFGF